MRKLLNDIKQLWCGKDGRLSIRRLLGTIFAIDAVRNFHHAVGAIDRIITVVYTLIMSGKEIDSQTIIAIGSYLSSIAMILGIEAGLVAAFFTLTTYQNIQFGKTETPDIASQSESPTAGQLPT